MSDLPMLDRIMPLVGIVAAERTRDLPSAYDDARQEGLIRAWLVLDKRPDAPREYVVAAAKNGVGDALRGRPAFGAASHRGRQDAADTAVPLIVPTESGESYVIDLPDHAATDAHAATDIRDVVRAAVADLPDAEDRLVVFGRYWQDRSFAEIAAQVGRPTGTLSRRWTEVIRPVLRDRLALLQERNVA